MPIPAHLTTRMQFEFASLGDAATFLEKLQENLEQNDGEGYICLTGSDTAWRLANEFRDAAFGDTVKFVCPAQDDLFDSLEESDMIAEVHMYNQSHAEEVTAFQRELRKYKDDNLSRTEKKQAIDDAIALIHQAMDDGKLRNEKFEPYHSKNNNSLTLLLVDKINFITRHERKYGRRHLTDGTHLLTLSVGEESNAQSFKDFAAPYNPSPVR